MNIDPLDQLRPYDHMAAPPCNCMQQARWFLLHAACLTAVLLSSPAEAAPVHQGVRSVKVSTWASFGIQTYNFVGRWHEQPYQATVFLRVLCHTSKAHTVRMVVSLHNAPFIRTQGIHSETPEWYLTSPKNNSGNLPHVLFEGHPNISVDVTAYDWEYHARKMTTAALIASAEVPTDVPVILRMQGSDRIYHLQQSCKPSHHGFFKHKSVWLAVVASEKAFESLEQHQQQAAAVKQPSHRQKLLSARRSSQSSNNSTDNNTSSCSSSSSILHSSPVSYDVKRYLVQQHLQHHRQLGFAGSIMVVTPHTADILKQSRALQKAMHRRELVLLVWDMGLELHASHFMQIPANNLLRLAAWGSPATLAFWDLDEFLVLPRHQPIQQEMANGCLQGMLFAYPEAIIPSTWVSSAAWNHTPELLGLALHGQWPAALKAMQYVTWPYKHCSGVCKVLVNPNTNMLFQVHGHHATEHDTIRPQEVSRSCAYLLHFYRLWHIRTPELAASMGVVKSPGTPLHLQEVLPHNM